MRDRLVAAGHDCATAVIFLTRVPVPWTVPGIEARLGRCTPWFPVVGLAVGAVGALGWWAGSLVGGTVIGALFAVAATTLLTGAFHEDGLADTFDGLGGSPERERALEIMKDSRIGTYGALALGLGLLTRVAALAALGPAAPAALVAGHVLARLSSLPLIRWLPYARADGGTGKPFAGGVTRAGLLAAAAFSLLVTLVALAGATAAAWLAGAAVVGVTGLWYRRRLAGITGDTLGATNQLVEVACYLAILALA